MKRSAGFHLLGVLILLIGGVVSGQPADEAQPEPTPAPAPPLGTSTARGAPILVTPDGPNDGGEFGLNTPGTRTSGIQEALDLAKATRRDVYIAGGAVPHPFTGGAVYNLNATLEVPWMQDFRLDGGEAVLNYTQPAGDAIVFDSLMSCRIKLGLVVSQSDGTVVRLQPRTKGPDKFSTITTSVFEINAIVGGGSVFPGEGVRGKGTGLLFDGASGSITFNKFQINEIVACDIGLALRAGTNNTIELPFLHLCNTHLVLGEEQGRGAEFNRIQTTIDSEGIRDSAGAVINGQNNRLSLNIIRTDADKNVIFETGARDNVIEAMALPQGITSRAKHPTNRIKLSVPLGFGINTPAVPPSGKELQNKSPFLSEIIILDPGEVREWVLSDAHGDSEGIRAPLRPGERFTLAPGESIRILYDRAPTWRWRSLD